MAKYFDFREQWLTAGIQEAAPRFADAGFPLPENIRVACGFPVGNRGSKKVLGQCFSPKASAGSVIEIFVNPIMSNPDQVVDTLFHELCHAAAGHDAGHGAGFKRVMGALGMTGKPTECIPGPALKEWIREAVLPVLGDYPHDAINIDARKKQSTRMVKLVCPISGYTVRTTQKWIAQGLPTSPAGAVMQVEGDESDNDE